MAILTCESELGECFQITPAEGPAPRFNELRRYIFSVDVDEPCSLFIDEIELTSVAPGLLNTWQWQPGFYAGSVLAELRGVNGNSIDTFWLDVSPDSKKLGAEAFQEMIDELFDFDPRLVIGTEAARLDIGVDGDVTNPHLEYYRLRQYGNQLVAAYSALSKKPVSGLSYHRRWIEPHQAQRFDQHSLNAIVRSPSAVACLQGDPELGEGSACQFNVPYSLENLDTPAHRTLLFILYAVIRRVRAVIDALIIIVENERTSETRTAIGPRLSYRLEALAKLDQELRRLAKRTPFVEVSRREVSAAGLNVISAHPLYGRAYRTAWRILRPGVAGDRGIDMLWLSPTWEIYERWCFLTTYRALQSAYPDLVWERQFHSSRDDCIVFSGAGPGAKVAIYFQARFPAFDQPRWQSFTSISAERYPDIVVTYETESIRRMIVFDGKYRTSRQGVLDAMQSAHLYRDCLRWGQELPSGSFLLIPAGGGASWLEQENFWINHRVGAIVLSPSTSIENFAQTIRRLIN